MASTPIINALIITGIGVGLVFIAILLLWGLMELVVRIKDAPEKSEEVDEDADSGVGPEDFVSNDHKRQAAVAAVAVAMALSSSSSQFARPDGSQLNVSSWQAVRRAAQFSQRANVFNRTPRGR